MKITLWILDDTSIDITHLLTIGAAGQVRNPQSTNDSSTMVSSKDSPLQGKDSCTLMASNHMAPLTDVALDESKDEFAEVSWYFMPDDDPLYSQTFAKQRLVPTEMHQPVRKTQPFDVPSCTQVDDDDDFDDCFEEVEETQPVPSGKPESSNINDISWLNKALTSLTSTKASTRGVISHPMNVYSRNLGNGGTQPQKSETESTLLSVIDKPSNDNCMFSKPTNHVTPVTEPTNNILTSDLPSNDKLTSCKLLNNTTSSTSNSLDKPLTGEIANDMPALGKLSNDVSFSVKSSNDDTPSTSTNLLSIKDILRGISRANDLVTQLLGQTIELIAIDGQRLKSSDLDLVSTVRCEGPLSGKSNVYSGLIVHCNTDVTTVLTDRSKFCSLVSFNNFLFESSLQ